MLRDFTIPISVMRGRDREEIFQKAGLLNDTIGGLWFLDDQMFVHGWFHFNNDNFAAVWDQVLHGRYAACVLSIGVEPVRDDVWTDGPLSIVSASLDFHRAPTSKREKRSRTFFDRFLGRS
jgi:hypothetical protein